MKLYLSGHQERYAIEQLQLALFPLEPMENMESPFEGDGAVSRLCRGEKALTAVTTITRGGISSRRVCRLAAEKETVSLRRQILQRSYYLAALPFLPRVPQWGALSGVRPTKLSTRHLLAGGTERGAKKLLGETYFVSPARQELAVACSVSTVEAVKKMDKPDVSLYVGIPFCPTRCAYCSFVSRTIGKRTDLMEPYLQALLEEIRVTGEFLANSGRKVRTIYIGGGTPTTLTAPQMRRLLAAIRESFDLSSCVEFTVEGGRPDTLDKEKLDTIAGCGVGRMSINPQTMTDSVLRACGRRHTAEDVRHVYKLAREAGYDSINMDLIAGLPTDTVEGFKSTLEEVIALNPENITVHTLALKKGADLYERRENLPSLEEVEQMVDYANARLAEMGYRPYYLYRQKYMSGSFENVGWAKPGFDCLYNIYMMEELHPILSLGAGGMNKVNLPGGRLERFHNPKFPEQYIEMLPQVLAQKEEFFRLLCQA